MLPPKFCRQFEKSTTLKDFLDFTEVWFLVCCVPRMEPYSGQYMRLSSIKQLELWEANKQQYFYFTFFVFPVPLTYSSPPSVRFLCDFSCHFLEISNGFSDLPAAVG